MADNNKSGFGYCDHHEEIVEEEEYRRKGCWGCPHFEFGQGFPYVFVSEAAEKLQVSESTIRRLIKKGKLEGELFEQQRRTGSLPAPSKYHISRESFKEFLESTAVSARAGNSTEPTDSTEPTEPTTDNLLQTQD